MQLNDCRHVSRSLEANLCNDLALLAQGIFKCCYEAAVDSFYISAKRIVGRQITLGTCMRIAVLRIIDN